MAAIRLERAPRTLLDPPQRNFFGDNVARRTAGNFANSAIQEDHETSA